MAKPNNMNARRKDAKVTSSKALLIRLTPAEHVELQRLAKGEGLTVSAFVRKWSLAVKGSAQQGYFARYGKDFPGVGVVDQVELERQGQVAMDFKKESGNG